MTTRATALVSESEELLTKMVEAVNGRRLVTVHERLDEPIPANAECVVAALDGSERRRRFEVFANQPVLASVPLIVVPADPLPECVPASGSPRESRGDCPEGRTGSPMSLPYGDGEFFVTIVPEELESTPRELWRLDGVGRVIGRYCFDRTWVGGAAAGFPRVFAVGVRDATIYEYLAGDQPPR